MEALLYYLLKVGLVVSGLALIGVVAWFFLTLESYDAPRGKMAIGAVASLVAMVATFILGGAFVKVPAGHRGVIFSTVSGVSDRVLDEGIHAVAPITESVKLFDVRKRAYNHGSEAATKDQQSVSTQITVWFLPNPTNVNRVYELLGEDYEAKLLDGNINEAMKAEVAKHNALDLLVKREEVSRNITANLKARLAANDVTVDAVALGGFDFSEQFDKAIEEKQVAEQRALQKQYELKSAQTQAEIAKTEAHGRAEAEIAAAKGKAESARIISQQANDPAYLKLKELDNRKEVAEALAKSSNVIYLPSNMVLTTPTPSK